MAGTRVHERIEIKVEALSGSGDLRMLYGMAVPLVMITGLIIAGFVIGATWLVAILMLLVVVSTLVVLVGLTRMLDDEDGSSVPQ